MDRDVADLQPPAPVIDCAAYCRGDRAAALTVDQIQPALALDDQFVWIGLYEPEQSLLRQVQKQFGLHDLAIEDAINAHQRPKIEIYQGRLADRRVARIDSLARHRR